MLPLLREQLRSFVGARKKVQLTRSFSGETHNGFVAGLGDAWLMLHQFHDFYPEGFALLRTGDITDLRSGEYERLWEYMLSAEGTLDRLPAVGEIVLDDARALLVSLQRLSRHVIVECEDPEEDLYSFYIGQILTVETEAVWFANYSALGKWDDAPHRIPLGEITKLQFDTPYALTFAKYLDRPASVRGRSA
jgi:hypothetical protein